MLEEWGKAAAVYAEILRAFPDDAHAYFAAHGLYHEKLHTFRDAFAVSERWLSRHPDDFAAEGNLAESYFTNGRFAESDSRITALLAEDRLEPQTKIALRAVQIAALLAQEKTDAMAERLAALHAAVAAQPEQFKGDWTFAGTNHFIAQHEGLRKHAWLSELLTAVGAANQTTMLTVIERAQASIKAVARRD